MMQQHPGRGSTVSQPPALPGDASGFYAVRCAELADRFGEIVPDRSFRQTQLRGDGGPRRTLSGQPQHLAFAIGQRVGANGGSDATTTRFMCGLVTVAHAVDAATVTATSSRQAGRM